MEADFGQQRENPNSIKSSKKPLENQVSHAQEPYRRLRHVSQRADRHSKRKTRASIHGLEKCLAVDQGSAQEEG